MNRRASIPVMAVMLVLVCAAVLYLGKGLGHKDTFVVKGSGAPAPDAPLIVEPHVDAASGILTIGPGDSVDSNGVLFQVTGVVAPFTASGGSAVAQPKAGQFLVVNVEVHNSLSLGGDTVTISPAQDFELRDAGGHVYDETTVPGAPNPPEGKLGPGETLDGALAFDVPLGQSYRLLFREAQTQGQVLVDLGKR